MLDPREVGAKTESLKNGIDTFGRIWARKGFDVIDEWEAEAELLGLTFEQYREMVVQSVFGHNDPADGSPTFSFSATHRRYRYRILNRRTRAGIDQGFVWHVPVPLDIDKMAAAAAVLKGHHDFNSFRSVSCQAKSSIRTLDELTVGRDGEEVVIDVGARSFLHNLVGTLALVGRGQWSRRDVEEALAACDRTRAGPTAPPLGLCLMEVRYGASGAGQRDDAEEAVDDEGE